MYYPALTWRPISSCLMQASTRGIVSSKRIISSATDLFRCRRATTAAAAMSLTKTRKVHTARREQSTLLHFWSIAYGLGQPDRGSRVSVKLWTEAGHRGWVLRSVTRTKIFTTWPCSYRYSSWSRVLPCWSTCWIHLVYRV